ncbi:unnamed protein product, partial [Ixodes hexagonus]
MILSAYSSASIEAVRREVPGGLLWFQLQLCADSDLIKELVGRAERAGFRAPVLTVDIPVVPLLIASRFVNFEGTSADAFSDFKSARALSMRDPLVDAGMTWDDVTWLKSITNLPVVIKGVMTAEDAEAAISRGASAILVSNHGGRQLDGLPATV